MRSWLLLHEKQNASTVYLGERQLSITVPWEDRPAEDRELELALSELAVPPQPRHLAGSGAQRSSSSPASQGQGPELGCFCGDSALLLVMLTLFTAGLLILNDSSGVRVVCICTVCMSVPVLQVGGME